MLICYWETSDDPAVDITQVGGRRSGQGGREVRGFLSGKGESLRGDRGRERAVTARQRGRRSVIHPSQDFPSTKCNMMRDD